MTSAILHSPKAVHQTTGYVLYLKLRLKLQDKEIGLFTERLGVCFSLVSAQYPKGGIWPRFCPIGSRFTSHACQQSQAKQMSSFGWQLQKNLSPETCKTSFPGDTCSLELSTGELQRWCLPDGARQRESTKLVFSSLCAWRAFQQDPQADTLR